MTAEQADRYRAAGWWTGERLIDRFDGWVAQAGELPAVSDESESVSRAELWQQGTALGADLVGAGGSRGGGGSLEIAVVFLPNTVDWMRAFVAVLRAGLVPATIPITTTEEGGKTAPHSAVALWMATAGRSSRSSLSEPKPPTLKWSPSPTEPNLRRAPSMMFPVRSPRATSSISPR